ncbi:LysM peptidoglycan-binding domain-containing M23 family metallopeptidase [Streptomyces sp. V2I9]|uniref:LysM peptidoglycan-binding domain-containing M23 family metallopeptidase n=1 Tax=Streptomyces sp. V2I9 TaxID=3042304 RepID=UPI00277FB744|nr:LysM peptidoglycan-binding domain-containing M23 family metallopeptidase [Streptomyces sp. V2I9]MDQ0988262.1 murein DD-endopeptidase MepM/ murein hydrolase activator NlpD [Streptomyces sp. V2I9]
MPAKGKHRRPKSGPISRGVLAAGTGGAALALPLIGATTAGAADQAAPAAKPAAASVAAAHGATAAAPAKAAPKTYSVVSGDYLSKIAAEHKIKGGWEKLYQDNRSTVGGNPSLIHPGMKLTLGAKGSAPAAKSATPEAAPKKAAPAPKAETRQAPKADTVSADDSEGSGDPARTGSSEAAGSGWSAPLASPNVTTQYRASGASWSSGYHTGSDFQAASGTPVLAIGPGTVVSAGNSGSYGNEVVIKHEDGMYSQYAHQSALNVSVGQTVTGGQQIGLSGSTGNSTGPHLHFEVRTGPSYGSDVDPIAYLRQHGVSV